MEITKKDLQQLEQNINKESKKDHLELVNNFRKEIKKDHDKLEQSLIRQNQVMYEKFQQDIRIIGEGWQSIKEKNDAIFEQVVQNSEDITMIKIDLSKNTEDIKIIKNDLSKNTEDIDVIKSDVNIIKHDLKENINREEFVALEKRVIFLENKLKRT